MNSRLRELAERWETAADRPWTGAMTETCAPPPEHQGHKWHWLRCDDEEPVPREWWPTKRLWVDEAYWTTPGRKFAQGWRYVAPVEPPQEGK